MIRVSQEQAQINTHIATMLRNILVKLLLWSRQLYPTLLAPLHPQLLALQAQDLAPARDQDQGQDQGQDQVLLVQVQVRVLEPRQMVDQEDRRLLLEARARQLRLELGMARLKT